MPASAADTSSTLAREIRVADANAGLRMDELVLEEPDGRVARPFQVLVRLVLAVRSAVTGVERVQEVEGRLEVDPMGVLCGRDVCHGG